MTLDEMASILMNKKIEGLDNSFKKLIIELEKQKKKGLLAQKPTFTISDRTAYKISTNRF